LRAEWMRAFAATGLSRRGSAAIGSRSRRRPRARPRGLEGRVILGVHRTGKHIVCELGPGPAEGSLFDETGEPDAQWIVHLGMTGRLLVTTPDGPVANHTHARLRLKSGREIRFVDPRRFGRLELRELGRSAGLQGAGQEPLTIGAEEFAERCFAGASWPSRRRC
jgi:formamidopyrimidine-DNA glycosylase